MTILLLVEDDAAIRIELAKALSGLGHVVQAVSTGAAALQAVLAQPPEVVILDLGLPDLDGWDVLRMIRSSSNVPVIAATARDDDLDIVRTLDAGADDYVTKPFTARQLSARVGAVRRRTAPAVVSEPVVVGDLAVDLRSREVRLAGQLLELAAKEFDLLAYLAARSGTVVSRKELLTEVWHQPWGGADKTVDVHLSWLRRKLGESAREPRYLRTVRGAGVKLVTPDEDGPSRTDRAPRP